MSPEEFDRHFVNRHDATVREACLEAVSNAPATYDWLWRGAMARFFSAWKMEGEAGAAQNAIQSAFQQAVELGAAAEKERHDAVEGVYWHAVADLELALRKGKIAASLAYGTAEKRFNRAAAIEEGYCFAGPVRYLGRVTRLKPLLAGGSLDRAISFFDRALQLAPENSGNLIYLADALLTDRQPARARATLHRLLELDPEGAPGRGWKLELLRDQQTAALWLKKRLD